jgi:hypothetical protein
MTSFTRASQLLNHSRFAYFNVWLLYIVVIAMAGKASDSDREI